MNKTNFLLLFFSLFLSISEVNNSDLTIFISIVILLIDFVRRGISVNDLKLITPLLLIVMFGAVVGILNLGFTNKDLYRDVYKTLSPVIFILLGANLNTNIKIRTDLFINSVVLAGIYISLRHLLLIIIEISIQGLNFQAIRGVGGNMSLVTILAVVFCWSFREELSEGLAKIRTGLCMLFLLSLLLYVSRTMLVIFIPFVLLFLLNNINLKRILLYIFYLVSFGMFLKLISRFDVFDELFIKFTKSFTEINYQYQSWDWVTINNNWRGYEIFLVLQQMKYAPFLTQVFGFGFGALLDLGVYILLGNNYFSSIPILHNGYYYILYKVGFVGLFLLILFFALALYRSVKNLIHSIGEQKKYYLLLIGCYVGSMSSMYVISGFYNGVNTLSFCMAIGYFERKMRRMRRTGR